MNLERLGCCFGPALRFGFNFRFFRFQFNQNDSPLHGSVPLLPALSGDLQYQGPNYNRDPKRDYNLVDLPTTVHGLGVEGDFLLNIGLRFEALTVYTRIQEIEGNV